MTFCPECGKPVAPNAKFCRICGASQLEDALSAATPGPVVVPAAAPLPSPAPVIPAQPPRVVAPPPQAAVQPVAAPAIAQSLCGACGSPLSPSEKFCGVCGARAGQMAPAPSVPAPAMPVYAPAPAPAAVPPTVPVPAQVTRQSSGVRVCNTCGNAINPGDKYCSKCLAIVRDNPPQGAPPLAAVPAPYPVSPSPAAAPGSYVCASCGSPITGTEKFCGICGATVVASRVPAPAQSPPQIQPPSPPVQKTCNACGTPVSGTTKFCGGCGAPVGASFRSAPVAQPFAPNTCAAPAAVPQGGEPVIGVIGNARRMKMLGASWDTYALVVTDRRMILAQLTADMLNTATRQAAERAKAEGKGFLEQMAHQMSVSFQYCQKYETLPPESALAETKGNRAIENVRITAIDMKDKPTHQGSMEYHEFIMTVQSADGKFEFHIGEDDRFINILKAAYGDKVHMPFGYFRAGGARIKLF
ncbi:MAG: zinc ribbon domain-containing protein [Methanoregula sp.]|nr:zinc ribbon domain-containing protein [Methanoregula sp.]